MIWLVRIFGWPHERLHELALRLIGRRALAITQTHTDIPPDLSTAEYVFVAGLPALVFWTATLVALIGLLTASGIIALLIWLVIANLAFLAGLSTLGDIHLIVTRLMEHPDS